MNVDELKNKLETELKELERDLSQVGRPNPQHKGDWEVTPAGGGEETTFRDDVADKLEEMDEREEIESTLEQRHSNVKKALEKIKLGEYGKCEICGTTIEADRLGADPAARTCKQHIDS